VLAFTSCESSEHKIDHEVAWKDVKGYPHDDAWSPHRKYNRARTYTARDTLSLGVPKEAYYDPDEEPRIIGEMDRDVIVIGDDDLANLDRIALAAYYHGGGRVILTEHKAFLVTSDWEADVDAAARGQ